jgi:hypothetical protein
MINLGTADPLQMEQWGDKSHYFLLGVEEIFKHSPRLLGSEEEEDVNDLS